VAFVDALPAYAPAGQVAGPIRLWGHGSPKHDFVGRLVNAWIDGFAKYQPGVKFENRMYGTSSAIGALYTGAGENRDPRRGNQPRRRHGVRAREALRAHRHPDRHRQPST